MASALRYNVALCLTVAVTVLGVQSVQGGRVECEKLPVDMCAFAVSSSGARCVLEKKYDTATRGVGYECQSSSVMMEKMMEWIETEECLRACGLQRMSVGMSSDGLAEYTDFSSKLCSDKCQNNCPNIVDLYLNLAAGEGMYLPRVCEGHKKREKSRRMMYEKVPATAGGPLSDGSILGSAPTASLSLASAPVAL
uniref:PAR1 protein n=1 Tax=Araucaria cunninghamii TaxID=56994 RepID=A0A0D6QSI1_ARACU